MPHRNPSMRRLPLIVALGLLIAACEDDPLTPVSGFTPPDCQDPTRCSEGGQKLDAGVRVDDAGLPIEDTDSGIPPVDSDAGADTDGGVVADSGADLDSGVIDTGPPPSDFLDVSGQWQTHYVFDTSEYLFGISG